MTFASYFKLSSYALIGSGFVAVASTGAIDIPSIVLFGAAFIASWWIDTEKLRRRTPSWVLNGIALAYFPLYLADYFLVSRSFVAATVHMIFYMAALKLMTRTADRDYVYLYLISFAELLAASTLTIDLMFGASLLVFLLAAVNTLVLFEMRRSHARSQRSGRITPLVVRGAARGSGFELFASFPARTAVWMSIGMTLMILLLAVPIFVLMPRMALGIYNRPSGRAQMLSGFSERVELGEIGTIKESDVVVMRVKLNGPAQSISPNTKWRGVALEQYDGRAWHKGTTGPRTRIPAGGEFYKLEVSVPEGSVVLEQTFHLEGLTTRAIFAAHRVLAVSSAFDSLVRTATGDLFIARQTFGKIRYSAISDVTPPNPALLWNDRRVVPDEIRARYLQLPPLDPRIAELARRVAGTKTHPYDQARALESHLRTSYGYSLELSGSPTTDDPLAGFLFDVRKGHCEYFASALAVMLRQLDIPARLVNGFRAGEYNPVGENWIVRQYDAHSWVEAYFPPQGWIEFDPTPPDPLRRRNAFVKMFTDLIDAVDLWWSDEVVNYSFWKQSQMIGVARLEILEILRATRQLYFDLLRPPEGGGYRARFARWRDALGSSAAAAAALGAVALGVLGIVLARSRWAGGLRRALRRRMQRPDARALVRGFYAEALETLERHGLRRGRGDTPLEFARSLGQHAAAPTLSALTEIYNRMRFGGHDGAVDASDAEALLGRLRDALRAAR